jgi:hypothetical protein
MRARTSGDAKPGEVKPGHDDPRVLARRLLPSALHSSALMNESHAHTHAETNRSSTCHITIVLPRTISPPGSARSPPTTAPPPARCVTPGRTLVVVRVVGFSAAETDERATFNDESGSPSRWPRTFSAYASGLRCLPACISISVSMIVARRCIVAGLSSHASVRPQRPLRQVLTVDPSVVRDRFALERLPVTRTSANTADSHSRDRLVEPVGRALDFRAFKPTERHPRRCLTSMWSCGAFVVGCYLSRMAAGETEAGMSAYRGRRSQDVSI